MVEAKCSLKVPTFFLFVSFFCELYKHYTDTGIAHNEMYPRHCTQRNVPQALLDDISTFLNRMSRVYPGVQIVLLEVILQPQIHPTAPRPAPKLLPKKRTTAWPKYLQEDSKKQYKGTLYKHSHNYILILITIT